MNKILFHSLTYPPESISTGLLVSKIVEEFNNLGFNIEVLASSPQYIDSNIEDFNNSKKGIISREYDGIKVHYIISKKRKFKKFSRFTQWISFNFKALKFIHKNRKIYKELFVFSYPPTMNLTCLVSSKIFKIKTHYSVWELYPEIAVKLGKIDSKLFTSLFKKLDNYALRSVENVIVNSRSLRDYLIDIRKINSNKIKVISHFSPNNKSRFFPDYKIKKIMYAGNLGVPQNLAKFINYFSENSPDNWKLIIFGSGEEYEKIVNLKNNKVDVKDYVSREELEIMTADIPFALVSLQEDILFEGFPGKTFDYLNMNKILVNFSNRNSVVTKFVKEFGLGLNIDANKLSQESFDFSLLEDVEILKKIAGNIKNYNENYNSPKIVADKYINLVSTSST